MKIGRIHGSLLFCLALVACVAPGASAKTVYVDGNLAADCPDGKYSIAKRDGSGADGAAYATVQKALDAVEAGDVVIVRGGVYHPSERTDFTHEGTASAYIELRSYPGETPVIDGRDIPAGKESGGATPTWRFQRAKYWKITGPMARCRTNALTIWEWRARQPALLRRNPYSVKSARWLTASYRNCTPTCMHTGAITRALTPLDRVPTANGLAEFFHGAELSLGMFYPTKHVVAVFRSFREAQFAHYRLWSAGFRGWEAISVPGYEMDEFLSRIRGKRSLWDLLALQISRFLDTEAGINERYARWAGRGSAFVIAFSPTEEQAEGIRELIRPLHPLDIHWFRAGSIHDLR